MITEGKRERDRRYRTKLKQDTMHHYGGVCYKCGEHRIELLELHHPNGEGNIDRASKVGRGLRSPGGWNFYQKLKKLGYPEGYIPICIPCHDKEHGRAKKEATP